MGQGRLAFELSVRSSGVLEASDGQDGEANDQYAPHYSITGRYTCDSA
jgi:hypothetical protein